MSPGWASSAAMTCDDSSADRNLATPASRAGPDSPSMTFIHARPFAPQRWQVSTRASIWLRLSASTPPSMRMPFTQGAWNTRASVPSKIGVSSTSSIPNRVSGLSEPYRSCASSQVMRANSVGRWPVTASAALATA